jgi:hypothetical protein
MWQMAQAMNADMLKRVTDVVALESPYSGVPQTLDRVRQANPNVRFHNYGSGQFGGNHSTLPGNTKVATAISNLAKAVDDGTTPPSNVFPTNYAASTPFNGTMSPTSYFSSAQPSSGTNAPYSFTPLQAAPVYQTGSTYTSTGGAPVQTAAYPSQGTTLPPLQMSSALSDKVGTVGDASVIATNASSGAKVAVSAGNTPSTKPVTATTFADSSQKQAGTKATSSAINPAAQPLDITLMLDDIFFQMENILLSILSLLGVK